MVGVALYTCCCGNSCCSDRRIDYNWSCTWSWCSGSSKTSSKVSSTFHSSIRSRPCWGGPCCPPYTLPSIQRPTCRWCVLFSSRSTRTVWKDVCHYIFIERSNYRGFKLWSWPYCWQTYRNSCIEGHEQFKEMCLSCSEIVSSSFVFCLFFNFRNGW